MYRRNLISNNVRTFYYLFAFLKTKKAMFSMVLEMRFAHLLSPNVLLNKVNDIHIVNECLRKPKQKWIRRHSRCA